MRMKVVQTLANLLKSRSFMVKRRLRGSPFPLKCRPPQFSRESGDAESKLHRLPGDEDLGVALCNSESVVSPGVSAAGRSPPEMEEELELHSAAWAGSSGAP